MDSTARDAQGGLLGGLGKAWGWMDHPEGLPQLRTLCDSLIPWQSCPSTWTEPRIPGQLERMERIPQQVESLTVPGDWD